MEKYSVDLAILKNAETIQNSLKIQAVNLLSLTPTEMMRFLTLIMLHSFWAGVQTLISGLGSTERLLLLMQPNMLVKVKLPLRHIRTLFKKQLVIFKTQMPQE